MNPLIKNGQPMRERNLCFLDLETTGLNLDHEIIEIGGLLVTQPDFRILEEFNWKIKPHHLEKADPEALLLNGYNEKDWENSIELFEALHCLEEKAKGTIMVGYNFTFDWARLEKAFFEIGRPAPSFYYHRLDVMPQVYLKLYNEEKIKRFSLGEICDYFGIDKGCQHSAIDDARATFEVYKKLITLL